MVFIIKIGKCSFAARADTKTTIYLHTSHHKTFAGKIFGMDRFLSRLAVFALDRVICCPKNLKSDADVNNIFL